MHLLEFEKNWKEHKLVKTDGQSTPLVKIFRPEDNADIGFYRSGLVFIQDVFFYKIAHVLKPKIEDKKIIIERLLVDDRGDVAQNSLVWGIVGELVKLSQTELEGLGTPKFKSP